MPLLADLRRRDRQPELMDQPDLDRQRHIAALRGLARINRWSASAGILWSVLRRMARPAGPPLRVLDLATGGGDIPVRLWRLARRAGLPLDFTACDISPTALEQARANAGRAGAEVTFLRCDVLSEPLPGRFDVILCSLFLHHLEEAQAILLLRRAAEAAERAVLVNDLRRCRLGLWAAQVGGRLLTASPVVHVDGPRSVRAAFTVAEAADLARRAGLHNARVARRWPFRFLLRWER